jgi:tRNA uridine 5-carboxymethylaminomethyl modification enzyme
MYPNGLSTSLPQSIQEEFIRTIKGLEGVEILVPGYAVEYDVVDTSQLSLTLEHTQVPGLYFAGQVNGTSGYEEAAGQGLVAGLNAALSFINKSPIIFNRRNSFIGVMVDDLVLQERDEPYRLFSGRSEDRLGIREDNAVLRMHSYRKQLAHNNKIDKFMELFHVEQSILSNWVKSIKYSPEEVPTALKELVVNISKKNNAQNLSELIKAALDRPSDVIKAEADRLGLCFSSKVIRMVAIDQKYEDYMVRFKEEQRKVENMDSKEISWEKLLESKNISFECKQRISAKKPQTFGQLKRMSGLRQVTLATVAASL